LTLLDHLLSSKQAPTELLLLVDEAQALPVTLLDELRVMTNLVHGGVPRVRLVVAGSPLLEETFAGPELESLSQRVAARCYLSAFSRDETAQFIRAQLYASGAAVDEVLRPEAWEAVFDATDGVPRLVNQLCDRAITVATAENCKRLDRRVVQEAWADLQQLPSPWQSSIEHGDTSESVVEFGGLADHVTIEPLSNVGVKIETDVVARQPPLKSESAVVAPADTHFTVSRNSVKEIVMDPADPFGEAFDEEEVVLDNFASMASLFSYGAPRVENRRDPEFASLARAAITAAAAEAENRDTQDDRTDASERSGIQPEFGNVANSEWAVDDSQSTSPYDAFPVIKEAAGYHLDSPSVPDPDDLIDELDPNWPPIRLAFAHGSDSPDEAASTWDTSVHDQVSDEGVNDTVDSPWPAYEAASTGRGRETFHFSDEPVLIVEDEHGPEPTATNFEPAQPQVRRQEYRRLFSRLRSG